MGLEPSLTSKNQGRNWMLRVFALVYMYCIHIYWLVVSTPLKNISQNGNLPQIGVKIKNIWNHHTVYTHQRNYKSEGLVNPNIVDSTQGPPKLHPLNPNGPMTGGPPIWWQVPTNHGSWFSSRFFTRSLRVSMIMAERTEYKVSFCGTSRSPN